MISQWHFYWIGDDLGDKEVMELSEAFKTNTTLRKFEIKCETKANCQ